MKSSWVRRPITGLGVFLIAIVLTVTLPLWAIVTMVVDAVRGRVRFPISRLIAFATCWAWLETSGLVVALFLFFSGRGRSVSAHYALQTWWCRSLIQALGFTVGLQISVEGAENVGVGPFVAFCRHASLADSIMSSWVVASHVGLRPRFVLKKELKIDPCLDILGHRLPNYFVDRESSDIAGELQGIEQMAAGLGVKDCAVIFPEGSRASAKKRVRALERLRERSPQRAETLAGLKYLIPPKPAGANALLSAVPEANVLTMWHSGFDGLDTF
ncbi:MAG: 1-acyl-sn-glycerol-3-phosphate acyltransferase, partial [Ilumatobacteraceae bacterium]|nr:1-acyl-sn-glycerol-3-phosphate acyltransferase [Ilumatobacteraceae bacterium]MBJ7488836.1 1-acyl-sn-glycerol-3-phosphate acyltransferase [Ilumatobacteraceae bacterium]